MEFVLFIVFVSMGFCLGYLYAYQKHKECRSRMYWLRHLDDDDFENVLKEQCYLLQDKAKDCGDWFDEEVTEARFKEELCLY